MKKGTNKKDRFETKEWTQELKKAAEGEYYQPGDDGLVTSLSEDVGELVDDGVDAAKDIVGVAVDGLDNVRDAAKTAFRNGGEDTNEEVVDATAAAIETAAEVVGDVNSAATESLLYEVAGEVAGEVVEEVADLIPLYGLCMGAWRLIWGSTYAVSGAAAAVTGVAVGTMGAVVGAAASPWGDGKLLRDSINVATSSATWGGSVMGEGTLGAVRGACNVVGQVPGTQFVTIPIGYVAKKGAKACKSARQV